MIFQWNSSWFFLGPSLRLQPTNRPREVSTFIKRCAITLLLLSLLCFSAPVWSAGGTKLQKLAIGYAARVYDLKPADGFDRRV
jgi:hypothetical protein